MNGSPVLTKPIVCCQVTGYAAVCVTAEQLPLLRRNPGSGSGQPLSPALLKHADPQTVAGVAAVLEAIHQHDLRGFGGWGVIAGPSLLGRQASAESLQRFREEGAFAISPHLVPHQSLHAVSGTVSQALGLQGPNFGVGGGPGAAEEALLGAATLLAGGTLPGLWVVLTEFDPELIPAPPGHADLRGPSWVCHAVALALAPSVVPDGLCLRIGVATGEPPTASEPELFNLQQLGTALTNGGGPGRTWRFRSGGTVSLGIGAGSTEIVCE